MKFRYGAWYLPPKTWEKRDFTDPLRDPKELKDQESSDAKEKSHKLVSAREPNLSQIQLYS